MGLCKIGPKPPILTGKKFFTRLVFLGPMTHILDEVDANAT